MAKDSIKLKAKITDNLCTVKALLKHNMETGLRTDKDGNLIPAHFIQKVMFKHNNNLVFSANWSVAVSKHPYLSFRIKDAEIGDTIELSWIDNKNDNDSITAVVS